MKFKGDPRHASRELALTAIFCWLFSEPSISDCLDLAVENIENADYDKELFEEIVEGVRKNLDEIDKIIEESAPEWPLDKIGKVDLVILRIAIFEMIYGKKVPTKVCIDEAVEIAKEFGTDTSHKFVNGVLGTVVEKYLGEKNE